MLARCSTLATSAFVMACTSPQGTPCCVVPLLAVLRSAAACRALDCVSASLSRSVAGRQMRVNLEPMTYAAGVDIFFYGAPLCCARCLLPVWAEPTGSACHSRPSPPSV